MIRRIRNRKLNESIKCRMDEAVSYGRFRPSTLNSIKRDIDILQNLSRNDLDYLISDLAYTINTFMKFGEVEDADDSVYETDDDFVGVLSGSLNKLRNSCEKVLRFCDSIENYLN